MYSSTCMTECRNTFYFTFKRVSKYFGDSSKERGFYVEAAFDQQMQ